MSSNNRLIGLESLRGFVAIYVFFHHAHVLPNEGIGRLLYFGQEAVIVFFILSGFVICYSTTHSRPSITNYLKARARRIYPIFIAAIVISYLAASIQAKSLLSIDSHDLVGNLLMLQDASALKPGVAFNTYYDNSPLWSLSYEWWFYIGFAPIALTRLIQENKRIFYVAAISFFGYVTYMSTPNQASLFAGYFVIWWAGVELCNEYIRKGVVTLPGQAKSIAILAFLSIGWLLPVFSAFLNGGHLKLGVHPVLEARHFLAATILVVLAVSFSTRFLTKAAFLLRPFHFVAPVSYFLYIAHQPMLNLASSLMPLESPTLIAFATLPIILLLGWLIEIRVQSIINNAIPIKTQNKYLPVSEKMI